MKRENERECRGSETTIEEAVRRRRNETTIDEAEAQRHRMKR